MIHISHCPQLHVIEELLEVHSSQFVEILEYLMIQFKRFILDYSHS